MLDWYSEDHYQGLSASRTCRPQLQTQSGFRTTAGVVRLTTHLAVIITAVGLWVVLRHAPFGLQMPAMGSFPDSRSTEPA